MKTETLELEELITKPDSQTAAIEAIDDDPLLIKQKLAYRRIFYPLGFGVEVETNSEEILFAAEESWGMEKCRSSLPAVTLRLGVQHGIATECPPTPVIRIQGHLMSVMADTDNFAVCDFERGFSFGWVSEAALRHRSYFRYYFLEGLGDGMVSIMHLAPIHAACVSFAGKGFLFCGASGAGKSTLAYACARAGWTYTSDDGSYLLLDGTEPVVRGNCSQVRLRSGGRELFPELADRDITPRAEGKPSIEIPTAELGFVTRTDAHVDYIIKLNRHDSDDVELTPLLPEDLRPQFVASIFPGEEMRRSRSGVVERLFTAGLYEMRYRDLDSAIRRLERLARGEV